MGILLYLIIEFFTWLIASSSYILKFISSLLSLNMVDQRLLIHSQVEEMQWELFQLLINFSPSSRPSQSVGSVFTNFLQHLVWKNRGADRNMPPPGVSSYSVLFSTYTILLHFLFEGLWYRWYVWIDQGAKIESRHSGRISSPRVTKQSFPVGLFLKANSHHIGFSRLGGVFTHLLKIILLVLNILRNNGMKLN